MIKQEIDNLKVGDVLMGNNDWTIEEILESKKFGKLFIFIEGRNVWTENEIMDSFLKVKQQPKKTPYTLETFPENALWFKNKEFGWQSIISLKIKEDKRTYLLSGEFRYYFDDKKDMENYEIGCQVIKDGKIEIEWKPFYQEV